MKKIIVLICALFLSACGAIGIGSNHKTMLYNNSDNVITVTSDSGMYKLEPNSNMDIYSKGEISIQSKDSQCSQVNIEGNVNLGAVILDVFPGFLLGIIPVLVDALTYNLYRMPEAYSYSCIG